MPQVLLILGPPGTGKTTHLAERIGNAAKNFGSNQVLVSSFTRAAAHELKGRDLPLPEHMVGTLHALCYRALDKPVIAETRIKEWNETHADRALSGGGTVDEAAVDQTFRLDTDALLAEMNRLRARLIPRAEWPEHRT